MILSLKKSEYSKKHRFLLKPSRLLFFYLFALALATALCFFILVQAYKASLLFVPVWGLYFYYLFKKHVLLCHPQSIIALQALKAREWRVELYNHNHYLTFESKPSFRCRWFSILYLRVPTRFQPFIIFIPKDSMPLEIYQLLLYQLS